VWTEGDVVVDETLAVVTDEAGNVEALVADVVVTDAEGDVEETLVVETSSEEEA
jgi:hypothetical protein